MRITHFLSLLLVAFSSFQSFSQVEFPEDKVKWKFSVEQNDQCQATIVAEVSIVPDWEINALFLPKGSFGIATTFEVMPSKEFKLVGKQTEPKPILHHDEEADEDQAYHVGKVKFKQKIEILSAKDFKIKIKYGYQTCKINSYCLQPFESSETILVKTCKNADGKIELQPVDDHSGENTSSIEPTTQTNDNQGKETQKKTIIQKERKPANENDLEKKSMLEIFLLSFGSGLLEVKTEKQELKMRSYMVCLLS